MDFTYNGQRPQTINYNGNELLKLQFNGITVWEKTSNTKIFYTSADGNIVEPYNTTGWSANIISNTYVDGQGCIEFDGVITEIPSNAFSGRTTLQTVEIPDSIESLQTYSFQGCTSLTSVIFGNNLREIRGYSFARCTSLTSVDIPDSVETFGTGTFSGCTHLVSANLGSGLTVVSASSFYNCYALSSITIPDSVQAIGSNAFRYCSGLTEVNMGLGVQTVGDYAFANCTALEKVNTSDINKYVGIDYGTSSGNPLYYASLYVNDVLATNIVLTNATKIGNRALQRCYSLTSITINDECTSIGFYAFQSCSALTDVHIGSGDITFVPTGSTRGTFSACTSLSAITIEATTAPTVDASSFRNVAENGTLTYPSGSDYSSWLSTDAYYLGYYNWNNVKSKYLYYTSTNENVVNPYNTTGWSQTIVSNTYANHQGIIEFDSSLTSIPNSAFTNATTLKTIEIPDTVETIGEKAFGGCTSLTNIELPSNLNEIMRNMFSGCTSLTSVELPNTITRVGGGTFSNCTSLTVITIPDSVGAFSTNVFYGCSALTDVYIGSGITNLSSSTFTNCSSLTAITITAPTAPTVDSYTFRGVAEYGTLTYPEGSDYSTWLSKSTGYLGYYHWNEERPTHPNSEIWYTSTNSSALTLASYSGFGATYISNTYADGKGIIKFDGSITTIPASAFTKNNNARYLKTIELPDTVETIGNYAFGKTGTTSTQYRCSAMTECEVGSGLKSIGTCAFGRCYGLTSIELPSSLQTIGASAFTYCSAMTTVSIGSGCTSVGTAAFRHCDVLSSITSYATTAPTIQSTNTFSNVASNGVLKHPSGSNYSSWMATTTYYLGYYNWTEQLI